MTRKYFLLYFALLSFFCSKAYGQETGGRLSGKVADEKGQFLPGVTVVALYEPEGTVYTSKTDENGSYALINLRAGGPYSVKIYQIGMVPQASSNVVVSLGVPTLQNFVMAVATKSLSEVVVKAARTGSRANATGAGTSVSSRQIRDQPATARSLQDYTKLTPQFNGNSFVGTNFRYNNVTIDGAINNDAIGFSPSLGGQTGTSGQPGSSTRNNSFSIDAIQDIQVYVAPYDVKIGNFTGGSVNAVTRSGSNEVHGSIYGFGRNAQVTGPDYALGTGKLPSSFKEFQTGFRVGFPLVKNKLFWFTNEEITRRDDPLTETASTVLPGGTILSQDDATKIKDYLRTSGVTGSQPGFDAGTAAAYTIFSKSQKYFNRLDWNVAPGYQLSVRNNLVLSKSTNLTRDDQNFRFSSIDYLQTNKQNSTVLDFKAQINSALNNNLILGYSSIHDYRDPLSNPYFPQVQIQGRTKGTTILLGSDREAAIFDLKQKTLEVTDNLTWLKGNHTVTLGTHNELYRITYNFVNSPNGRVDYPSVEEFLLNEPNRIRGNYNYENPTRSYALENPSARFGVNMFSAYLQDEWQITSRLKLIPGLRFDLPVIPGKQSLSIKTVRATPDPDFGNTHRYTPPAEIINDYLGRVQVSPRLGFNFDVNGNGSVVLRGGSGLFTGRIPFAWLGYAFYNNGNTFGAYDRNNLTYIQGPDPAVLPNTPAPGTNVLNVDERGFYKTVAGDTKNAGESRNSQTQIDLIDNRFKMPQVWRTSAALDITFLKGYKLTLEGIFTKTIYDVKFENINLRDSASFFQNDLGLQQPVFKSASAGFTANANDPALSALYLLSNTHQGYRYSATAQIRRGYGFGLDVSAAYTYGVSKDISNGIRNSLESNWQLNQALNPNSPKLAYSNFDLRHRIIASLGQRFSFGAKKNYLSLVNLFFTASSGSPFTYGFVNASIQNSGQQVSLVYIPQNTEYVRFFQTGSIAQPDGTTTFKTDKDQAQEFYEYVDGNPYLRERQGQFTERNAARTPWNTSADLRFSQIFVLGPATSSKTLTFTWDIINVTNLLNKSWGMSYFSSDLFNSTASVGLTRTGTRGGYPIYSFNKPSSPYQVDTFASRWQMQFGLRYSF